MTQMTSPDPIIEFVGVDKAFGPKVIYDGLDLQIRRGEILTLLGRSGTGKSVMLRMMLGLLPVEAGRLAGHKR